MNPNIKFTIYTSIYNYNQSNFYSNLKPMSPRLVESFPAITFYPT